MPYIGWPFIILGINKIYNEKLKKKLPDNLRALKSQLAWGQGYIGQFWFQWDLIVTLLLFIIIIFIFRKHHLFILQLILILFYYFQYTGNYFQKYLKVKKNNRYTIGRMFEMIPLGVTGFIIGYCDIINRLHKYKFQTFVISYFVYYFIGGYNVFLNIKGFCYQGIGLNIKSICIIFIFSLFPSEKIKNKYTNKILTLITNHSAGIFYLHLSIKAYLRDYNDNIKKGTFLGVIITYLICYIISLLGHIIFDGTILKHLFY